MQFKRHREFKRQYKKLNRDIREKFEERLHLLVSDDRHPLLDNHKLHHPYDGYSSINITGDWRLVYKKIGAETYYLRAVGTHHQLYGT
ncbi:MAG TPA: type II toxin-antitoxin system mRNA interferase toxin, RelE/StbE family [Candidatus Paceibacterota bacterium]|nr:type II toxin-antitoxin system mRNA interferase toxin, RelE/StbE family [Candidatus Paceibacterota bacterium]